MLSILLRRIAKDWKRPITMYYKIWQPGETNISDQWMQTIIKELHQKL
jgi:hypothetical protein